MSLFHAVVLLDHHKATIRQFDAEHARLHKVSESIHDTRQHHSAVRSEHEFFGEVCEALAGVSEVLVVGSHTVHADFLHYVEKHAHAVAKNITGWETADSPTDGELLAMARKYFIEHDRMIGTRAINTAGSTEREARVE